ncbi:MAG: hypothetical protein AAF346_00125 [Pseudomonadota bacterium]
MQHPWPDYLKREMLAKRLSIAPGAVDQYVKRGLLPKPIHLGEAILWRWADVDAYVAGLTMTDAGEMVQNEDSPYSAAVRHAKTQHTATPSRQ